jgi:thioredoxin 1
MEVSLMPTDALCPVNTQNFDATVLGSPGPFLVEFTAPWCGPCKVLAPLVAAVASELAGRLSVGVVDAEESPAIGARYRVTALPTLILFRDGQEVGRRIGTMNRGALRDFLGA